MGSNGQSEQKVVNNSSLKEGVVYSNKPQVEQFAEIKF